MTQSKTLTGLIANRAARMIEVEQDPSASVRIVGIMGLVPIVLLTAMLVYVDDRSGIAPVLVDAAKTYCCVVLIFLGGIHWGLSLGGTASRWRNSAVAMAVMAPLIGWTVIFVSAPMCFALLMVGFAGQGAWDNIAGHYGMLPPWYCRLRLKFTFAVVATLAVAMLTTA